MPYRGLPGPEGTAGSMSTAVLAGQRGLESSFALDLQGRSDRTAIDG